MIRKMHTIYDIGNILRTTCEPVKEFNEDLKDIINDLVDTLHNGDEPGRIGVGLAAPQIGINKRIIIAEFEGDIIKNGHLINKIPRTILINPKIVKYSKDKSTMDEGCFSVPNTYGPVERPNKIKIEAQDINGKLFKMNVGGYFARVLQHEIDHLNGVLFTDYINDKDIYSYEDGFEQRDNYVE